MKTLITILSLVTMILSLPAQAGPKKKAQPEHRIAEVDAVSITLDIGRDGSSHEKFKITDATKVTLDGAPAAARDLKAGMDARVEVSSDHTTAISISAKDPHPGKHKVI